MNREQLMSVLIAPHVTEKTSLAMQNHNQYTFKVRREATKTDVKKAVAAAAWFNPPTTTAESSVQAKT